MGSAVAFSSNAGKADKPVTSTFSFTPPPWTGLIRDMPGGSYDPLGIATRAQTAVMVVRLLRYENLLP